MDIDFRMTGAARDILLVIAAHESVRGSYGNEIARESGRAVGTVYPLLVRMEKASILASEWENIDPSDVGRPAIRYWRLTDGGAEFVEADRRAQLARLRQAAPRRVRTA